ncbi:tetratricopeptide repeat protein, partial [Vibrio sp. 2-2(9)]|nr:tetratricopeptide repeat protein [Vibrio sp. 2-2(9)]
SAPSYWDTLGYQINQRLWIPDRSGSNQRRRKRRQDHNGKLICFPWIWFRAYRTL